jgi:outer membrane protein
MLKYLLLLVSLFTPTLTGTVNAAETSQQSLIELYQQALAHDPVLSSALNSNLAAQELIEQGKALYRPTVNFNAAANASQTDINYIGSGVIPFKNTGRANFEGYSYGVDARQPIFRKQNLVQMDQSKTQVSQADKQLQLSQQDLMLRITQVYFEVLIAQDKIDLIGAQKAAILNQLDQAKANFEVGTVTITDTNEAQARFDLVLAQEIAAINEYEIAKRAVQAITGDFPQKLATLRTDIKTNRLEQNMESWLSVAVQNNLSLQVQQESAEYARQEVERLSAGHLPTLDAVASYTDSYANGSANGFGSDLKSGVVGLQLQVPLYQGGAISSRVRQAVLNEQKAKDDVEAVRRKTELETQRAYLNLNTSIAQVKAYEQALMSSQSQVDSTKLGYEVGVRTSVDVLNAQQQFFGAKRDLLQSRYNYLVSIIRLKTSAGVVAEADLADINQQLEKIHGQ